MSNGSREPRLGHGRLRFTVCICRGLLDQRFARGRGQAQVVHPDDPRVQFTAKLSAELSIGGECSAGAGIKDDDKEKLVFYAEPESKSHTDAQKERRSGDDKPLQIEMVGAGLTAKAGFQTSIEYSYERFYAEDRMPLFYTDAESREEKDSRLRTDLAMILQEGSTKTMLKAKACALMAKNKEMFKAANPLHWEAGAESLLAVFYLNSVAFIADSAWGKKFDGLASIVRTLSSECARHSSAIPRAASHTRLCWGSSGWSA